MKLKTKILGTDQSSINKAARILASNGLVAFPTETVYGLGSNALSGSAMEKIFLAKNRPRKNPLIIHVNDINDAQSIAVFDETSTLLANKFWPGPLTLLLPKLESAKISYIASSGQEKIGIRVPSNQIAQRLLITVGLPIAAPSANLSNHISPTSAEHVLADLDGRIDAVIDGGNCQCGLESTILMPLEKKVLLIRPGSITKCQIQRTIGTFLLETDTNNIPQSPGQHHIHYSPQSALRIMATSPRKDEVWIGFGPEDETAELNLSPHGDLNEAAYRLYSVLRQADALAKKTGRSTIAVAPVSDTGIGNSINDRLFRAAGSPNKF